MEKLDFFQCQIRLFQYDMLLIYQCFGAICRVILCLMVHLFPCAQILSEC